VLIRYNSDIIDARDMSPVFLIYRPTHDVPRLLLTLYFHICTSVCECSADNGDGDNVVLSTAEEEVPFDTEFLEYVDVEGRTADYTATSDADLLTDGLRGTELPGAATAVSK